jgi:hypothetical protein
MECHMDIKESQVYESNLTHSLAVLSEKISAVVDRAVELQEEIHELEDMANLFVGPLNAHDKPVKGEPSDLLPDTSDLF